MFPEIWLLNARSVTNKFDELCASVSTFKPDMICVTETWMKDFMDDSLFHIDGFQLLRNDRCEMKGGGVCAWIKDSFSPIRLSSMSMQPACIECLLVSLSSIRIICVVLYIPPGLKSTEHQSISNYLCDELDIILSRNPDQLFMVCGDFNDFDTSVLIENFDLTNKVVLPTRGGAFLDMLWMNEELSQHYPDCATIGPPLANSDHNCVVLKPAGKRRVDTRRIVAIRDYRESNIDRFVNSLSSLDFGCLAASADVEDMCKRFYELFNDALESIPTQYVAMSSLDKPWMTPILKLLIDRRWRAYKDRNWKLFAHYKAKVKEEICKAKRIWAAKCFESQKHVWNVVKHVNNKSRKCDTKHLQDEVGGLKNLIEMVALEFRSNLNDDCESPLLPIKNAVFDLHINEYDVFRLLSRLRRKKAPGSDGISPRLLREGAFWLSAPLATIFNKSIQDLSFPSYFKIAKVCPVPKKNRPEISDFRPISLLPIIAKLFERLVLNHMKTSLIGMYGPQQHAFRPLGSTTSALVDIIDSVSSLLDSRDTDAVRLTCLDLSKAFDRLPHNRLLNSLNLGGIDHGFLNWLASYLKGRRQYVMIEGVAGSQYEVVSGVPQGSVLGPYLFAAYMGALIPDQTMSKIVVYADDITVVESVRDDLDSCVTELVSRITDAGLSVNQAKCTSVCIDRIPSHDCARFSVFPCHSSVKILGFIINDKLTWNDQITSVIVRASRRLYAIRVLRTFLNKHDLKLVYDALITSLITYASPVYGHLSATLMTKLERLQKRAHRIICDVNCNCNVFEKVESQFNAAAISFLLKCERHKSHPLHGKIPPRMIRTNHFMLPASRTERRIRTFLPFACILANQQTF
jgi:hypothetical protein